MPARQQEHGAACANEGHRHVRLGVPDVTLGAEKLIGALAKGNGSAPFDQFVNGAYCQCDADTQESGHLAPAYIVTANQDFSGDHGWHEVLHEMADFVVRVAGAAQQVLQPVAQRDAGVGLGTTTD